jgi:hypothetical protein
MTKRFIRILIIFLLHISLLENSQVKAQQLSGEDPDIIAFHIGTFHDSNGYHIDAWAEVHDPQGENDINTVKVIDANGDEFSLQYQGSDIYYGRANFELTLPPLGDTRIVATDKSGNSCTVNYNLANVVEQLPTVLFPEEGALISDIAPIFNWTDVSDDQSTIIYFLCVYRHDNGEIVWQLDNISESQVRFNFDGKANESLQAGLIYDLEVMALDTQRNSSYDFITFSIGSYIFLENDLLNIKFHPIRPQADQYTLKTNNGTIYGDIANEMFHARVFFQDEFYNIEPSINSITQTSNRICYHMRIDKNSDLAVTFDLCYLLEGNTVEITFSNISEEPGYQLIYVRSPDLITIRGTQTGAKLVFPYAEGRLVDVATTEPGYADVDMDASSWGRPLLMGMLYYDSLAGIASYNHLDSILWTRVFDHSSQGRLCTIGMTFNYRYAPTNFSSATFIDVFDAETSELSVKLTFTGDYDGDQDIDWMDGAKFLRDQVKAVPDQRYLSSFITKTGKNGVEHISDHLTTIRKLFHLTDHNKIYSYLLDYNPRLNEVFGVEEDLDPDFATLEDLREVFQIAEESYNTFLSFNDIYLDYYPGTPGYDPDLRVILDDGSPAQGWFLPSFPDAFQADPYDYAIQEGLDRVKRTVGRYPIKESYHIDVLSVVFPKDYSPGSPSSRERNRRGIQLIIDEFAKSGINITSEVLSGQLVESGIGWFLDTPRILTNHHPFSNPEIIPLIEFICHGKTLYGLYPDIYPAEVSAEQVAIYTFLEPLLLGANSAAHINYSEPNDLEIDKFYLIDLPWMALNQRFMQDYEENGSYRKITYDSDTFVEIDYEDDTYTVQVDGRVIGRNYTTFFPKDKNTFLAFSRDQKSLSEPLPRGWNENTTVQKLTAEGNNENIPFEIKDRIIIFEVEANTPYKITNLNKPKAMSWIPLLLLGD